MYKVTLRNTSRERRKKSIRGNIFGTLERPRLSVFRSNRYIYAQIIDDIVGKTLVSVFKESKDLHKGAKKLDASMEVGKLLAKKALEAKITKVVFDRNGYKYSGRVKNVAEGARLGGLEF